MHHLLIVAELDHESERLAEAAPARQLVAAERVEAAVGREDEELVRGLGRDDEFAAIALLVLELRSVGEMALDTPDPALLRTDHRNGLALDIGLERHLLDRGRRADLGAPLAECRLRAELGLERAQLLADPLPALAFVLEQRLELGALGRERLVLLPDRDLLEPAQGAQAHVEDRLDLRLRELEAPHHHRLRVVLLADDADHLVEIEVGDAEALEDLEALLDLAEAVPGAPHEHVLAVIEIGAEDLAQAHDSRA